MKIMVEGTERELYITNLDNVNITRDLLIMVQDSYDFEADCYYLSNEAYEYLDSIDSLYMKVKYGVDLLTDIEKIEVSEKMDTYCFDVEELYNWLTLYCFEIEATIENRERDEKVRKVMENIYEIIDNF